MMTQREREEAAEGLTRIWECPVEINTGHLQVEFEFYGYLAKEVLVGFKRHGKTFICELQSWHKGDLQSWYKEHWVFVARASSRSPEVWIGYQTEWGGFAARWRPFFRRCCWLSGCIIEASAHEQVEWMQGFTVDEVDVWRVLMASGGMEITQRVDRLSRRVEGAFEVKERDDTYVIKERQRLFAGGGGAWWLQIHLTERAIRSFRAWHLGRQ